MKLLSEDQSGTGRFGSGAFDPVLAGYRRLLMDAGCGRRVRKAALCRYAGEDVLTSDPAAVLLGQRMLPIRVEVSGGRLFLSVLAYSLEGGLRRRGVGATFAWGEVEGAVAEAVRGFKAMRREVLFRTAGGLGLRGGGACAVSRDEGMAGSGATDEVWLGRQLTQATGGLGVFPLSLRDGSVSPTVTGGDVDVDGVRVSPGGWVWVRLETRAGVVMTEIAMLVAVERVGGATRLVLRGADGVVSTCWMKGPGWTRRVAPAEEGDVWRGVSETTFRGVG